MAPDLASPLKRDFLPLVPGSSWRYDFTDLNAPRPPVVRVVRKVVSAVPSEDGGIVAALTWTRGENAPEDETVFAARDGLRIGRSLELRYPVRRGDTWEAEDDPYFRRIILAVDVRVQVPAGAFDGCVELGFTNQNTDSGSRFYAPGVGLVKETWEGENHNSLLVLI